MSDSNSTTETYCVPVIDPATGDGWDEEIEAESPRDAMAQVDSELHVAAPFVTKHLDIDV
jgi:hypothetical protein